LHKSRFKNFSADINNFIFLFAIFKKRTGTGIERFDWHGVTRVPAARLPVLEVGRSIMINAVLPPAFATNRYE
jgi:hypothetical protein